jgi:hypothetical protein
MRGVGKSARIEFFLDPSEPLEAAGLQDATWRKPVNDGRYWARTSDLQLVELALSQLS